MIEPIDDRIYNFLKDHPGSLTLDVEKAIGISHTTARRHLKHMENDGTIKSTIDCIIGLRFKRYYLPHDVPSPIQQEPTSNPKPRIVVNTYAGTVRIIQNDNYNLYVWLDGELCYGITANFERVVDLVRFLYHGSTVNDLNLQPVKEVVKGTQIYEKSFPIKREDMI